MKSIVLVGLLALGLVAVIFLLDEERDPYPFTELVLKEDARLDFEIKDASLSIHATSVMGRTIKIGKCQLNISLIPRENRLNGSLGGYDTGKDFLSDSNSGENCGKIVRAVMEEGQLHFEVYKDIHLWLNRQPKSYVKAWTKDGLLVRYGLSLDGTELSLDLFQLCMKGKRADTFWQSEDGRFSSVPDNIRYSCSEGIGREGLAGDHWQGPSSGIKLNSDKK